MYSTQEDERSRFKLAQLWHFVNYTFQRTRKAYMHNRVVNEILKDDFNVNYKITANIDPIEAFKSHLNNCTALHFLCYKAQDIDTFTTLIERGADVTVKNGNGQTVIHLIMTKYNGYIIENDIPFINAVLSAHVKFQNPINPRDDNGISHLHGACIANHVETVECFLENRASVEEVVNLDAASFAGYTPLHFAAEFGSFEVARILVSRGANVNAKTAEGMSPLDQLVQGQFNYRSIKPESREQMIKLLLEKGAISAVGLSDLHVACTLKDLTIAEKLLDQGVDIDFVVPKESSIGPGNTALHFAVDNSFQTVKMLLKRGAKIAVANDKGKTALDVCISKYSSEDVCNILSSIEIGNTYLSDGQTNLLDLISAIENLESFKLFLQSKIKDINAVVSNDSILWPGFTLLHLAVIFCKEVGVDNVTYENQHDKTVVEECLNRGLSVNKQNVQGQTPVHLAFRQNKYDMARFLLEYLNGLGQLVDSVDEDNLSYLHIACVIKGELLVEELLRTANPNVVYSGKRIDDKMIEPGSTPLHVAIAHKAYTTWEALLRRGANLHAVDQSGMTPVHWLHYVNLFDNPQIANVILNSLLANPEDRVVDGLGLSYLHIACFFGNVEVVERLLDLGSNVNAAIKFDNQLCDRFSKTVQRRFRRFSNFTPLQIASIENVGHDVLDVLLRRGADMFVSASSKGSTYLSLRNKHVVLRFFQVLWEREDMQEAMEMRLQVTKLHIACYLKNEEAIKNLVNKGVDVNARINAEFEMFAGCTSLHLLMNTSRDELPAVESIVKLLLDHGADVTIANAKEDTPIHVFYKQCKYLVGENHCKDLLLNAHQNLTVNPLNAQGISHFHIACLWQNVEVVEKFLQHGTVDVNQPIDYFASFQPGCTPLHLILCSPMIANADWTKLLQIVDVLLNHGADVNAQDVRGDTPLHKPAVLKSPEICILEKLVRFGGDMKIRNVWGQTPIEELADIRRVNTNPFGHLKIFQKYGYKINSWNHLTGEGYIAKLFLLNREKLSESSEFKKFLESSDARTIDSMGRTAIHNSDSLSKDEYFSVNFTNYFYAIDSFIKLGIDIDHQDKSGQSALHYAARMENLIGIEGLLACGSDVNAVDSNGKTAFSYALEHSENKKDLRHLHEKNITIVLRLHLKKLQHLGIEVSQFDQDHMKEVQHFFENLIVGNYVEDFKDLSQRFFSQVEMTKTLDIGTNSLTLFNFLSEKRTVNSYCFLLKSERELVDHFFFIY